MVKLSPKACNVTIQLRYDELTCYMFANIIQAGVISSHQTFWTHFLLGTIDGSSIFPSPYYELLMKKGASNLTMDNHLILLWHNYVTVVYKK